MPLVHNTTGATQRFAARFGVVVAVFAAFGGVLLVGCPGTLDNPSQYKGDGSVTCFDVPTELASNCTTPTCHNSTDKAQNLDLQSPGVEARLINQPATECVGILVNPASPPDSILYKKLRNPPPCGLQMPLTKPPYDDAHAQCFLDWIQGLAGTGGGGGGGTGGAAGSGGSSTGGGGGTGGTGGI